MDFAIPAVVVLTILLSLMTVVCLKARQHIKRLQYELDALRDAKRIDEIELARCKELVRQLRGR